MSKDREARLSDSAALGGAGTGYLASLGLEFGATAKDVVKSYRKSALLLHPDKVKDTSPQAIDRFQAVNTAYQVMSNDEARKKYMVMYRIRCHLYQQPYVDGNALAPFYVLHVKKSNPLGLMEQRVLTIDLCAACSCANTSVLPCAPAYFFGWRYTCSSLSARDMRLQPTPQLRALELSPAASRARCRIGRRTSHTASYRSPP